MSIPLHSQHPNSSRSQPTREQSHVYHFFHANEAQPQWIINDHEIMRLNRLNPCKHPLAGHWDTDGHCG